MSYVSGNLQNFNNRLHQLPSNTGDLSSFRLEGVNYTYSSGYNQHLNREYRKWYYSFTQNPSFLTGWYLNAGGQSPNPSFTLIGWTPSGLGITWQPDVNGGLAYTVSQNIFRSYSESQRNEIQGIQFFSPNNTVTGNRLLNLTELNSTSYPSLIQVMITNGFLTGLDCRQLNSLQQFNYTSFNNNRLTSLNFAGTNITTLSYSYNLATGFSGIQFIDIFGATGLVFVNFLNAFKNSSTVLDQFMVDLANVAAPNGYYGTEGNVPLGPSGLAAASVLETKGWTIDIL